MTNDLPTILMNPSEILCSFHAKPWKENWKQEAKNVIVFCMGLFDALIQDEDFIELCEHNTDKINEHMPKPLCCWAAVNYPEALESAYKKVGVEPPIAEAEAILN